MSLSSRGSPLPRIPQLRDSESEKVTKEVFVEIEPLHRSSFRTLVQAISVPGNGTVNTEIAIWLRSPAHAAIDFDTALVEAICK